MRRQADRIAACSGLRALASILDARRPGGSTRVVHLKRILCPTDFSELSRHALDHAMALACRHAAALSVMYVHPLAVPAHAVGPYAAPNAFSPVPLTDSERADMLNALHDLVADDRRAGVPIDTLLDEDVCVGEAVVAGARELHADLIVMGTHGRSGFKRLVLGSVSEKVLRTAHCPVLTIPPRDRHAAPTGSWRRIVCPTDFLPSANRALTYAGALASQSAARLTVVHVVEVPAQLMELGASDVEAYRASRFDAARQSLDATVAGLDATYPVDKLVLAGTAYREILRLADDQQADVVVMGVRGRGMADRFFFGSTTQHVVRQARCPVLTVREP